MQSNLDFLFIPDGKEATGVQGGDMSLFMIG
jgi:hypothetical protein